MLYKKTNFKKVGFSTMAFTAKILSWRFRHLNIVGCLLKRRPTKEGSRAPQDPPPPNYAPGLWDFYVMFWLGASLLMFETIFMIFSLVGNSTDFSLVMHHFVFNFPQNRLVWSGSRHMIVWFSWIISTCDPRVMPNEWPTVRWTHRTGKQSK